MPVIKTVICSLSHAWADESRTPEQIAEMQQRIGDAIAPIITELGMSIYELMGIHFEALFTFQEASEEEVVAILKANGMNEAEIAAAKAQGVNVFDIDLPKEPGSGSGGPLH